MTSISLPPIPPEPVSQIYRPEVYQAFADLIKSPEIKGIGANVYDLEILRLACLEKVRRHGPNAEHDPESDFKLHFLANIHAPWADDRVLYWDEGLGYGWNLLVFEAPTAVLMHATLFHGTRPFTFALYPIPARLPAADCEIHQDYSICRLNKQAPPLTAEEKAAWDAINQPTFSQPYDWGALGHPWWSS